MRTNIIIDDSLMADVLKATGAKSKREAVELGLKTLLMLKQQEGIKAFKGKLAWEGDLEQMRTDRWFWSIPVFGSITSMVRKQGITIRKTIDTMIATYCIENELLLLHSDKDFQPFQQFLGLQVA